MDNQLVQLLVAAPATASATAITTPSNIEITKQVLCEFWERMLLRS